MPGYKGHTFGALVCNTAYVGALQVTPQDWIHTNNYVLSDVQLLVGLYVVSVLFGLFPDIDTNSKGQDIFLALPSSLIFYSSTTAGLWRQRSWGYWR